MTCGMEDTGPLATLAGIRDLPEVPPSLATMCRWRGRRWQDRGSGSFRHGWPAIAAAVVVAAGVVWWNSGSDPATGAAPWRAASRDIQPDPDDTVDLPLAISEIDTKRLERGLATYTRAGPARWTEGTGSRD